MLKQIEFVLLYLINWVGRGILLMGFVSDRMRYLKDHFEQFRNYKMGTTQILWLRFCLF